MKEKETSFKTKLKSYFMEKEISRAQYIITIVGLLVFVFMNTTIFQDADDMVKVLFYAGFLVAGPLLGVKFIKWGKLGDKFKDILSNKLTSVKEKLTEMIHAIMPYWNVIGETFEDLNELQFSEKEKSK